MTNKSICIAVIGRNCKDVAARLGKSSRGFDEKIYVDDYSEDGSLEACTSLGFITIKRHLNNDFSAQRNFVLETAQSDWVFFLDSDEKIDKTFLPEVRQKIENTKFSGFLIPRKVYFLGYRMRGTEMGQDRVLRLGKRKSGSWIGKVHETWQISGNIGRMDSSIYHYTALNLHNFIDKLNYYHKLHSSHNSALGKYSNLFKIILFPRFKFIDNFVLKRGYKDLTFGFVVSVLMSFHSFLSWSHSWLTKRK